MSKKKSRTRSIQGGGLWSWFTGNSNTTNPPSENKKGFWEQIKSLFSSNKSEDVQPPINSDSFNPKPVVNNTTNNLVPNTNPQSVKTTVGGKRKNRRTRKKRKSLKQRGGHNNYKTVHHTNMAKPTYWLNYPN